jgi:transposase-like protein
MEKRHAQIGQLHPEHQVYGSPDAETLSAVITALDSGVTKAAVCRTFGIRRSTLIDSLARIGWSAGLQGSGGMSGTMAVTERSRSWIFSSR